MFDFTKAAEHIKIVETLILKLGDPNANEKNKMDYKSKIKHFQKFIQLLSKAFEE
jgi:hypothetical protein